MTRYDMSTVAAIGDRLAALPPRQPVGPQEIVQQLMPRIEHALGQGYSLHEVHSLLQNDGLTIAYATFRNYLSRARVEQRRSDSRTPADNPPSNLAPPHPSAPSACTAAPQEATEAMRSPRCQSVSTCSAAAVAPLTSERPSLPMVRSQDGKACS